MSVRLDAYTALERVMLELDEADDALADRLRDMMDPIWYALTDEEHALLDARTIAAAGQLHPIRCPAGPGLFIPPRGEAGEPPAATVRDTAVGRTFVGWELAA